MASENKYKEIHEEKAQEQEPEVTVDPGALEHAAPAKTDEKPRKPGRSKNFFRFISFFDIVDKNRIVHAMPFILFLTVLALFYITNSFYVERTIRGIDRTKKELKEKRAEFISTKSKLMLNNMQFGSSTQHASAASLEIKESTVPPKKIVIKAEKSK